MEKQQYPEILIDAVVGLHPLQPAQFEQAIRTAPEQIRQLLASNPHLTEDQLTMLVEDSSEKVRAQVASHPKLNWALATQLLIEDSTSINRHLAGNAAVPEDVLLVLFEDYNPGLRYFAHNPNCPNTIRDLIRTSHDLEAKRWLKETEAKHAG